MFPVYNISNFVPVDKSMTLFPKNRKIILKSEFFVGLYNLFTNKSQIIIL